MHKIKEKMNNNVNPTGSNITKMLGMHNNQNVGGYTQCGMWHHLGFLLSLVRGVIGQPIDPLGCKYISKFVTKSARMTVDKYASPHN